jgi:hypothetical protein
MNKKFLFGIVILVQMILFVVLTSHTGAYQQFDFSEVAYFDRVKNVLRLKPEHEAFLAQYGFVSVNVSEPMDDDWLQPALRMEDFYYGLVYHNDLPVFITTDSILHLFHVVFDCSLRILEGKVFYSILENITCFGFENSLNNYNSVQKDDSIKYWAVRNSTIYFAVALSLLRNQTVTVPEELNDDVNFFLNNIWTENPNFIGACYWIPAEIPVGVEIKYDFTQFKPRGHYLGSPVHERYFQAMMWYGYLPIFIPCNNDTYHWCAPHFNETSVVYMLDLFRSSPAHYNDWMKLYNITGKLVGESDSINPLKLEKALKNVFGESDSYLDNVSENGGLCALREELSKPEYCQRILSQPLVVQTLWAVLPRYPLVFQFMGQRYVPDSYIFQKLCWDRVGPDSNLERRILPKGLDLFAVLGSERANQLLIPDHTFENFSSNLLSLQNEFQNLTETDWIKTSYTAWIYTLQSLVDERENETFPAFMQSLAWKDEKLNTVLGSWAQLRHDTLLYAKQTYIPAMICSYPEAFAEPYPEFYRRMYMLAQRTLEAIQTLSLGEIPAVIISSMEKLKEVAEKLETISNKELRQEPLAVEEVEFLKQVAWRCGSGGFIGWYADTVHEITGAANYTSILETPVIADVATFPPGDIAYPPQILHVGTGYVNALVVLFPLPNGTLAAAVGPVFTYYEFKLIGTKRLNDNEWKQMLKYENRTAYLPEWLKDIYGAGAPWPAPEFSHGHIILALTISAITVAATLKKLSKKPR